MNVLRKFEHSVPFHYWNKSPSTLPQELPSMVAQMLPQAIQQPKRRIVVTTPPKPKQAAIEVVDLSPTDGPAAPAPVTPTIKKLPSKKGKGGWVARWSDSESAALDLAFDHNAQYSQERSFVEKVATTYCDIMGQENSRPYGAIKQRVRNTWKAKLSNKTPTKELARPPVTPSAPMKPQEPTPPPVAVAPVPPPVVVLDDRQLKLVATVNPPVNQKALYKQWVVKALELQAEMEAAGVSTCFLGAKGTFKAAPRKKR